MESVVSITPTSQKRKKGKYTSIFQTAFYTRVHGGHIGSSYRIATACSVGWHILIKICKRVYLKFSIHRQYAFSVKRFFLYRVDIPTLKYKAFLCVCWIIKTLKNTEININSENRRSSHGKEKARIKGSSFSRHGKILIQFHYLR